MEEILARWAARGVINGFDEDEDEEIEMEDAFLEMCAN